MANENRLKVEITKSGYQAAIDNSRDANGFKIKISKADVYDDKNNLRGTFDVVGKNIGQQQILLRITVVDKTTSYGIKTIKLIDKYSGVEFAIISHPAGEMIDYINPHKIAYISCNLIITSMDDHTVTIIDSSSADADMGVIDGQIAAIWEAIEHLPGVNLPGNQDTSGNAATASKLLEGRNIGGVFFDGTKDIDLPGVNTKGNQDTTGNASTATYAGQIAARKIGGVTFNAKTDIDLPGVNIKGNQDTSGNAATATKLQNAACINGIPFDGSKDINATPAGAVMYFAMGEAPVGWLKANGAAVSRTTYAGLFAVLGTYYGAGDGSTTFNLPDLRGEFIRSYDDRRGVDPGRRNGSWQGDAIRNITGACSGAMGVVFDGFAGAFFDDGTRDATVATSTTKVTYNDDFCFDASRVVPTANENRPRNIALLACIKI